MNDELDEVVFDGIRFLESMTRYYGAEKGMALWESMGEALGDEIKGKVFFSMLTGETSGKVRFSAGTATDAVGVIKAIRSATGAGLKEAKDIWDLSKWKIVSVEVHNRDAKRQLERDLKDLGLLVS